MSTDDAATATHPAKDVDAPSPAVEKLTAPAAAKESATADKKGTKAAAASKETAEEKKSSASAAKDVAAKPEAAEADGKDDSPGIDSSPVEPKESAAAAAAATSEPEAPTSVSDATPAAKEETTPAAATTPTESVGNEKFQEALNRAKRIAEELKRQQAAEESAVSPDGASSKRGREDDSVGEASSVASKRATYDHYGPSGGYADPLQQMQQPQQYDTNAMPAGYQPWVPTPPVTVIVPNNDTMMVPGTAVGYLIGRKGETLKSVEMAAGVRMQFDAQDTPNGERRLTISGPPHAIQVAKQMMTDKMREMDDSRRGMGGFGGAGMGGVVGTPAGSGNFTKTEIRIPTSKVGLVIGRGASTVKDLSLKSGCKIFIVPENQMPAGANPAERVVELTGTAETVEIAKRLVFAIVEGQNLGLGMAGGFGGAQGPATIIEIPDDCVGLVIGKGGESIKNIQFQSRANVKVDQTLGNPTRQVYITGDPMAIETAKQMISDIINRTGGPATNYGLSGQGAGGYGAGAGGYDYGYGAAAQYGYGAYGGAAAYNYGAPAAYGAAQPTAGSYGQQPAQQSAYGVTPAPAVADPSQQQQQQQPQATSQAQQQYDAYYAQYYSQYQQQQQQQQQQQPGAYGQQQQPGQQQQQQPGQQQQPQYPGYPQ